MKKRGWILLAAVIVLDWILIWYLPQAASDFGSLPSAESEHDAIAEEILIFPIPQSSVDASLEVEYVDSWQFERTYGGERKHEGCDLMLTNNQRGIYPVVSMTDGIVEQMGWLPLGGYRIGIRTGNGTYFYYAHLESYAPDVQQGDEVAAGTFLGFAGDSGYGEEGTTGQFAAHLHLGIYVPGADGTDVAVDPYPYLKQCETKRCKAIFYKIE